MPCQPRRVIVGHGKARRRRRIKEIRRGGATPPGPTRAGAVGKGFRRRDTPVARDAVSQGEVVPPRVSLRRGFAFGARFTWSRRRAHAAADAGSPDSILTDAYLP